MDPVPLVILGLVIGVFIVQIPLGLWAYFDANRQNADNPEEYALGIIVPAAGLLVFVYYLVERRR